MNPTKPTIVEVTGQINQEGVPVSEAVAQSEFGVSASGEQETALPSTTQEVSNVTDRDLKVEENIGGAQENPIGVNETLGEPETITPEGWQADTSNTAATMAIYEQLAAQGQASVPSPM